MSVTHVLCNKARCWMGVAVLALVVGCSGPPSTLAPGPSCTDGLQNNDETDVDCGGSCTACPDGQGCARGSDCASGVCEAMTCAIATCGDGVVNQAGEVCDDGGESATCNADCTAALCGDGVVNASAGEVCDTTVDTPTCDTDCTAPLCGDSHVNAAAGEDCDAGDETDTCDLDCTIAECGDGTVNLSAGEWCDDAGESDSCDMDCTPVQCGDAVVNATAGEQCDTGGNSMDCDMDCTLVECGDGFVNRVAGETCDDIGESAMCDGDCTAAQCGDSVVNITAGETCDDGGESATCDVDCTTRECGDGVVNAAANEICDTGGESAVCDVDCTPALCGDGQVNAVAGEVCDLGDGNSDHGRCGSTCFWGAGLDGSFGAVWDTLSPPPGTAQGLASFHYSDQVYIHDFALSHRYDPTADTWSPIPAPYPFGSSAWANAAVGPDAMWIPRDGAMYRFDPIRQTWTVEATAIPDGSVMQSAAVFDGDGFIWYHGPGTDLVRYDPATATAAVFAHPAAGTMAQTRFGYDPVTNSVVFTGFVDTEFTIFDIDTGAFSTSSPNPGGYVQDNTCQDRSGNIYTGSTDLDAMYQYNVATDLWTTLGPLPFNHDFNSTCVVSQDGYLYYTASGSVARLPLGVR